MRRPEVKRVVVCLLCVSRVWERDREERQRHRGENKEARHTRSKIKRGQRMIEREALTPKHIESMCGFMRGGES